MADQQYGGGRETYERRGGYQPSESYDYDEEREYGGGRSGDRDRWERRGERGYDQESGWRSGGGWEADRGYASMEGRPGANFSNPSRGAGSRGPGSNANRPGWDDQDRGYGRESQYSREMDRRAREQRSFGQDRGGTREGGSGSRRRGGYGPETWEREREDQGARRYGEYMGRGEGERYGDRGEYGRGMSMGERRYRGMGEGRFGGGMGEGQYGRGRRERSFDEMRSGYRPEAWEREWEDQGARTYGEYMGGYSGEGESYGYRGGFGSGMDRGERQYGDRGMAEGFGYAMRSREGRGPEGYGTVGQRYGGGYAGRGPKGYRRSDDRIRDDVCEHLTEHPGIDASNIEIEVREGEVTLKGTVHDRNQKRMAEDAIEELSGVREVSNQIRVEQMQQPGNAGRKVPSAQTLGITDQSQLRQGGEPGQMSREDSTTTTGGTTRGNSSNITP